MMRMQVQHFEKKGLQKGTCDDVFYISYGKGRSMFLLADGVKGGKIPDEGIYTVAERLTRLLHLSGNEENWTEELLKKESCRIIQNTMGELASKYHCDKKTFASTLLLVFVEEKKETVWIVHIGDGVLLHLDEEGKIRVLSYPHYGILKHFTYTTANKNLYHLIRVSKKQVKGWILGMTDGLMNEIMDDTDTVKPEYAIMMKNKDWDSLERWIEERVLYDDASFFAVSME